jgi:protein-tyrosine phosphatase
LQRRWTHSRYVEQVEAVTMQDVKVLFVCMGNICRSPTAQGMFEMLVQEADLSDRVFIDSAGTHAYHVGEKPDARARDAASRRGIDLSRQRARRISAVDFDQFDYVVAMDRNNLEELLALCPEQHLEKIYLLLDFAPHLAPQQDVPDPYYGGTRGFEQVLDLVEEGARGLLDDLKRRLP